MGVGGGARCFGRHSRDRAELKLLCQRPMFGGSLQDIEAGKLELARLLLSFPRDALSPGWTRHLD